MIEEGCFTAFHSSIFVYSFPLIPDCCRSRLYSIERLQNLGLSPDVTARRCFLGTEQSTHRETKDMQSEPFSVEVI